MAQTTFEFSGRSGVVALGVAVLAILIRLSTLGPSDDPQLLDVIRAELRNDLGNQLGKKLAEIGSVPDGEDVEAVLEHANDENITVHSYSVSKPLFELSSNADAVVRVEYSLPGVDRRSEYWRFTHATLGGWRYRHGSSAASYYLNFL